MNRFTNNLMVYPRHYSTKGEVVDYFVYGLNHDGYEVCVSIDPNRINDDDNYTIISDFKKTGEFANNKSCRATDTNSKDNHYGVVLFTQTKKTKIVGGVQFYTAQRAFLLSSDKKTPQPITGIGRINVSKDYKSNNEDKHIYPVIMYEPEKGFTTPPDNEDIFYEKVKKETDIPVQEGISRGILIRYCDKDGFFCEEKMAEYFPKYNTKAKKIESYSRSIRQWFYEIEESWDMDGGYLDIIPIFKINAGLLVNNYYNAKDNHARMKKHYYKNDVIQICHVVAKLKYIKNTKCVYHVRLYALDKPLGMVSKLTRDSTFNLKLINEDENELKKEPKPLTQFVSINHIYGKSNIGNKINYFPKAVPIVNNKNLTETNIVVQEDNGKDAEIDNDNTTIETIDDSSDDLDIKDHVEDDSPENTVQDVSLNRVLNKVLDDSFDSTLNNIMDEVGEDVLEESNKIQKTTESKVEVNGNNSDDNSEENNSVIKSSENTNENMGGIGKFFLKRNKLA